MSSPADDFFARFRERTGARAASTATAAKVDGDVSGNLEV